MILRKKKFFSVYLHSRKMLRKIFYIVCLEAWSNVKKKNPHPKPLESTKNGNHHCNPPPAITNQPRDSRWLDLKLSVSGSSRTSGTISLASSSPNLGWRRSQRRDIVQLRSVCAGPTPWRVRPCKRKATSTKRIGPREQRKRVEREQRERSLTRILENGLRKKIS